MDKLYSEDLKIIARFINDSITNGDPSERRKKEYIRILEKAAHAMTGLNVLKIDDDTTKIYFSRYTKEDHEDWIGRGTNALEMDDLDDFNRPL